ncbi:MAG: phospholipase D family protein [Pseudomonadota bacterium]
MKIALRLCAALLLAGCARLQPVSLAPEFTPPPAEAPVWSEVASARDGSWYQLLNTGPAALDWRLHAIDSATESLSFQTFLWHFDTAGSLMLDRLLAAADRGVRVRVLVDDTFLVHQDRLLLALAEHPNLEYRVYNPFKRRGGGLATRQLLNLAEFHRLDHRMHNKAMVVDNRIAIVGGRNIADEYFGLDDEANFRDLELIAGGDVVQEISEAFDDYWNDRWSFPIDRLSHRQASMEALNEARSEGRNSSDLHQEDTPAERLERWLSLAQSAHDGMAELIVDEPARDNPASPADAPVAVADRLIELFDNAEQEIVMVSAYLIPTPELEGAIERARARGVAVRMLTNSIRSNNHLAAHSAYRNHLEELLGVGAALHEVRVDANDRPKYMLQPVGSKELALHAKALLFDSDKVFIGSANLDPRSLRINTEMGLLVTSESLNQQLRRDLEGDFSLANAWRLTLEDNGRVRWTSSEKTLDSQPAGSFMQRLEDWMLSHLPLENEM